VVLTAGGYTYTILPELGFVGASLTAGGDEYLVFAGADAYAGGEWTGLPILYPWANRLSRDHIDLLGRDMDVLGTPGLIRDPNGVPIHGSFTAISGWEIEAMFADATRALLHARFDLATDAAQLAAFPFPHELSLFITLGVDGLRLSATVSATGGVDVPVSFGWHPYFTLPGVPRQQMAISLPAHDHLQLDGRLLPTGESTPGRAGSVVLEPRGGLVSLDDVYRVAPDAEAALHGGGKRLSVVFEGGYHYLVVYAPLGHAHACIEPMVAATNAFVDGDFPVVPAGESYTATFSVRVGVDDPVPGDTIDHEHGAEAAT
jgi:galactose mutarotase-like enzyme